MGIQYAASPRNKNDGTCIRMDIERPKGRYCKGWGGGGLAGSGKTRKRKLEKSYGGGPVHNVPTIAAVATGTAVRGHYFLPFFILTVTTVGGGDETHGNSHGGP